MFSQLLNIARFDEHDGRLQRYIKLNIMFTRSHLYVHYETAQEKPK